MKSFAKPLCKVVKKIDKTKEILLALDDLKHYDVLVGTPQEKSSRKKSDEPTNAELGYIHSKGSPIHGIPPRPYLEPAIEANKEIIEKHQKEVILSALDKGRNDMQIKMKRLGMLCQNFVKSWFLDPRNNWPALSAETIKARLRKRKYSKNIFSPLIDTSQLRNSIVYAVRNDKRK